MKSQETIKVEVKNLPEMNVVYYEHTGAYDQSFNNFSQLMEYIQKKQLPTGASSIGIFKDDPKQVSAEDLRSEIGFLLTKEVSVEAPYKFKKLKACKAVSAKYTNMEQIMVAYQAIAEYIAKNNLKTGEFSIELYYGNDETTVDAEIFIPIID